MARERKRRTTAPALGHYVSTKSKGDSFEKEVADIFRYLPNADVTTHRKINGKDVDILVVLRGPLTNEFTMAVDTKDYEKPLSRDAAAAVYSSYYPLVANGNVDQFVLVTRNGIVANAKECFDGKKSVHYTVLDLQNRVVDPTLLLDHMENQFSEGHLDQYYVPPLCYNIDLEKAIASYNLYFNEFITFSISHNLHELDRASSAWRMKHQDAQHVLAHYDAASFKEACEFRRRRRSTMDLEQLVDAWIADEACTLGLALLGTYGTGKSSFARRMTHKMAKAFKAGASTRIPLLIELKDFGSHQSIEGLITNTLVNRYAFRNGSFLLFKRMNELGRYLLIMDGFDEMKQGMTRDALAYNFSEINSLCSGRSKIMLCGRPTIFEDEEEQAAILSGGRSLHLPSQAKYLPVEIAPLTEEGIMSLTRGYASVVPLEDRAALQQKMAQVEQSLKTDTELKDLLSRPVHIPMFITILPNYTDDILKLRRGSLYKSFIDAIIHREVYRLPRSYQQRYSSEQRFEFSELLAVEMARAGETKSIRISEIPERIIELFKSPGESIHTARRDLVAACFLDRKPPDILSVGHKSFLEFLVACRMLGLVRSAAVDSNNPLLFLTSEMASFALDLMTPEDVDLCIDQSSQSREFLIDCMAAAITTVMYRHVGIWFASPMKSKILAVRHIGHEHPRRNDSPMSAYIHPYAKPLLERLMYPEVLAKFSKLSATEGSTVRLPIIFVLCEVAVEGFRKSPSSSWQIIFDLCVDDLKPYVATFALMSGEFDESVGHELKAHAAKLRQHSPLLIRGRRPRPGPTPLEGDRNFLSQFVRRLRPGGRLTVKPIA